MFLLFEIELASASYYAHKQQKQYKHCCLSVNKDKPARTTGCHSFIDCRDPVYVYP